MGTSHLDQRQLHQTLPAWRAGRQAKSRALAIENLTTLALVQNTVPGYSGTVISSPGVLVLLAAPRLELAHELALLVRRQLAVFWPHPPVRQGWVGVGMRLAAKAL